MPPNLVERLVLPERVVKPSNIDSWVNLKRKCESKSAPPARKGEPAALPSIMNVFNISVNKKPIERKLKLSIERDSAHPTGTRPRASPKGWDTEDPSTARPGSKAFASI